MKSTKMSTIVVLAVGLMVCFAQVSQAAPMGTAITYQGRLMDKNKPADGLYDFQFKLYDSNDPCTGTQLASPIDINDLDVIDGHFVVELDFGSDVFDGSSVWLETRVVRSPMGSDPATLSPLVELTPTPYALYAETAGGDNDWRVSGSDMYSIPSGNVGIGTSTPEARLSIQMRGSKPIPSTVGGLVIKGDRYNIGNQLEVQDFAGNTKFIVDAGGNVGIGTIGPLAKLHVEESGSADLLRVRVSGSTKLIVNNGGNVGIGTTNPQEKLDVDGPINTDSVYKIGGSTVLSTLGTDNTFVGIEAGANNTTGFANTFLGDGAGYSNTTGFYNTFLGELAGYSNTAGYRNTFLGLEAGNLNTTGSQNTFLGQDAGHSNTTGRDNTFLGRAAGYSNTTGNLNTFVGLVAGASNTTGGGNVFIGYGAGSTETGSNKLYIANGSDDSNTLIYGDFSTGNVGIGTTSPQGKFEVSHDGTSHDVVVDSSTGNVGIGTRFPDKGKLEVNGEISTGHGGLRWKLYQGTTGRDYVSWQHLLDADKIYSISCVLRNGADGTGIAQECEGLSNILNQFIVVFDDNTININNIGTRFDDDNDTYRCIVWYVD